MKNKDKLNLIYDKYRENKNSHVYLVETNSVENALQDIKELLIKINDRSDNDYNTLINEETLPTLSIIRPESLEITKDSIEELIKKLQMIPVITKENYFIICEAEKLNSKSGNIMLKCIEEPESDMLGFFICNSSSSVLKTIQSRCQYISLVYDINDSFDENLSKDVKNYFELLHNDQSIYINKDIMDKYKDTKSIIDFIECLIAYEKKYINTLKSFDIIDKETKIIKLLYKLESDIRKNGNASLLFDRFIIEVSRL